MGQDRMDKRSWAGVALAAMVLALPGCRSAGTAADRGGGAGYEDGAGSLPGSGQGGMGAGGVADVSGSPLPGGVMPGSQQDLAQTVGDRIYFGTDRFDLNPESQAILDRQADWLRRYPNVTVSVEGHADERGTREYNLALGDRRALAVRNYLVARGVAESRIGSVSFGKERPESTGADEQAWARNRRAVTTVQ